MTDLARLHELLEKGSPRPWTWLENDERSDGKPLKRFGTFGGMNESGYAFAEDAALLVAAVNALPGLLEQHEQMREARESLRAKLDDPYVISRLTEERNSYHDGYISGIVVCLREIDAALVVRPDQKGTGE